MIEHNGQFANLGEENRVGNGIRNGEQPDESDRDYYYDDATGYEPYDGEAEDEDDDKADDSGSAS